MPSNPDLLFQYSMARHNYHLLLPALASTIKQGLVGYSTLIGCLFGPFLTYAQDIPVVMDDIAFVLEQDANRKEVRSAMEDFYESTQTSLRIAAIFADDIYAPSVRAAFDSWLPNQEYGISILLLVNPTDKDFYECALQASSSMVAWLPTKDRQRIQQDIMEYYFRSTPIVTDAYSQGLLGGIRAMKECILVNKNRSEPLSIAEHVQEILLTMQAESNEAGDSLTEAVARRSEALEKVIAKGHFYPPRIKGPNDEFIGVGMSKYAAPIVRTTAQKAQMEPIMLELDSVRNDLYWTDFNLQQNLDRIEWIEEALVDEALAELSEKIAQSTEFFSGERQMSPTGIRAKVEQIVVSDLKEPKQ